MCIRDRWESSADAPNPAAEKTLVEQFSHDYRYDLEMSFSRGLHTGWMRGIDNQVLVHARFGTKRGVYLGEVARVAAPTVWLRSAAPVKPGDGIVFDAGRPDLGEEGGRIHGVNTQNGETALRFGRGDVDLSLIYIYLTETVTSLFEAERVLGVLHLLSDHRPSLGAGESRFYRGAIWFGPLDV